MNRILAIIAITLTFFSMTTPANAGIIFGRGRIFGGGCGRVVSGCNTCVTPVVYQEIVEVPVLAYPVLIPAYQFQYVPPAYAPAAIVPVTGYPVATPLVQPVAPLGYGTAMPQMNYGQQPQNLNLNSNDKIRELAKALLEEMNKAADGNNGSADNGPPAVPGTQPYQPSQPQQPFQPQPQLQQLAFSAMARTCAQCHTGVGSKHDMVIFTQPGLLNQNANWAKIKTEVASGRMPPKDVHFQLSQQERQWIIQWLSSIGVN